MYCKECGTGYGGVICPRCQALNFQGCDWTELFEAYGLDYMPHDLDENGDPKRDETGGEIELQILKEYLEWVLSTAFLSANKAILQEAANILRQFLASLSQDGMSKANGLDTIWGGMARCSSDWDLVAIAIPIIGYMWS